MTYHSYKGLRAPEALGVKPYLTDEVKVDLFYFLVNEYKKWLLGSETGREELFSEVDIADIDEWLTVFIAKHEDYSGFAKGDLALAGKDFGALLVDQAERMAHLWALANIDECAAKRRAPDWTPPWEQLIW